MNTSRTGDVPGTLFIAQDRSDRGIVVGRFRSFREAQAALDERYPESTWQGIRDERSGHRWWRSDAERTWRPTCSVQARQRPH